MSDLEKRFEETLRGLTQGELPVVHDYNEFVGHADVVRGFHL